MILWLDGAAAAGGRLGGKARTLARLAAAGLPVPPGFVVTSDAFAPPPPADAPSADGQRAVPTLPEFLADAIRAAYAELGRRLGEPEPPVAVRSSAAAEDLHHASFAGQYDTFLGVRGAGAVVEYVARCWESLWSDRVASYRARVGADGTAGTAGVDGAGGHGGAGGHVPPPAMAVLVQALVAADAAGVAFTADPMTGARTHVALNAAWGLGQSVVDGAVEADTYRVDRASLTVTVQSIGDKATTTGVGPDAARVPVDEARRRAPCLTPAQAVQVAVLAIQAESAIGAPADVEWALARGGVWLLQARPITTGAAKEAVQDAPAATGGQAGAPGEAGAPAGAGPTPAFPFQWPDAAAPNIHWELWRIWRQDGDATEPLRPLDGDIWASFHRTWPNAASITGKDRTSRALQLNGYLYTAEVDTPGPPEERERRREAFQRPADALHERGENYFQAVIFPEVEAGNRRLAGVDVAALAPPDLATHLEEALRWHERSWTLHWCWPQNTPTDRFVAFYKELTGEASDDGAKQLLAYVPTKLSEAVDGLVDLARTVQRQPALAALFAAANSQRVLDDLDRTEGGAAFRRQLDAFLEQQGLRCGAGFGTERGHCLPGWRDDPTLVIDLVRRYVPQDLDLVLAARAAAVAERDRRAEEVRSAIADAEQRARFDFLLDAARRHFAAFEDHNYHIDSAANSLLHRAVTAAARRLAAAGRLAAAADVWWLHAHEIAAALRGLDAGASAGAAAPAEAPNWPQLAVARKALHEWYRSLTPPSTLGAPAPPKEPKQPGSEPPAASGAAPAEPDPQRLLVKGQRGSAGCATGRVRLIPRDALVPDVERGDVLVAHNAGPIWTPVFPLLAAVVLDEGVLFQHAMLTCREYGVPAVFQTKDATRRLQEGQRVTVDADHGWVLAAG